MRRLLTTGIKAILAIAALTTAAHWTMRLQREPIPQIASAPAIADDPVTTGSITPQRSERAAPQAIARSEGQAIARSEGDAFDQSHLAKLFSDAATVTQKPAAKVLARH